MKVNKLEAYLLSSLLSAAFVLLFIILLYLATVLQENAGTASKKRTKLQSFLYNVRARRCCLIIF